MLPLQVFAFSFFGYSLFRYFDAWSTKLCLAELDPEMHEINPLLPPLLKRLGFNKTMVVTWILFAIPVGVVDTLFFTPNVGIPVFWLMFGLFHLMAAANNMQIYVQMKIFGAETIRENTVRVVRTLKGLSNPARVVFLMKMNLLNIFFAVYGVVALVLLSTLLTAVDITIKQPIPILLLVGPLIMILDLVLFFPTLAFGSLLISFRRLRVADEKVNSMTENQEHLTVSTEILEEALREARVKNAESVEFKIPHEVLSRLHSNNPKDNGR